jgi:ribosomal protein S18 acetylase RimI-like enzyme
VPPSPSLLWFAFGLIWWLGDDVGVTSTSSDTPTIRLYRSSDRASFYDVCLRTAEAGGDARGSYAPDEWDLVPSIFAGPYPVLEPELAFVLDDGTRVVGYVVGAADTPAFAERFRNEWLPEVGGRFPEPAGEPRTPGESMSRLLHHPERMVVPELSAYPAHLHIDLLPEYQRAGHGRRLLYTLLAALRNKGVSAVHLGMVTTNAPARVFYDRLGFHEITVSDPGVLTYLGRDTVTG